MEKIDQLLRDLAASLGTTVEYLWPKLVQYEFIYSIGLVCVLGLCLITFLSLVRFLYKKFNEGKEELNEDQRFEFIVGIAVCSALSVACLFGIQGNLTNALVPEAACFKSLVDKVKGQ